MISKFLGGGGGQFPTPCMNPGCVCSQVMVPAPAPVTVIDIPPVVTNTGEYHYNFVSKL